MSKISFAVIAHNTEQQCGWFCVTPRGFAYYHRGVIYPPVREPLSGLRHNLRIIHVQNNISGRKSRTLDIPAKLF